LSTPEASLIVAVKLIGLKVTPEFGNAVMLIAGAVISFKM